MKLLFVDDDFNSIAGIIQIMESKGHEVLNAGSISEGYEMCRRHFSALGGIVLDMRMPGSRNQLGGIDLADRILLLQDSQFRVDQYAPFVPIAALSQLPKIEFQSELHSVGAFLPEDARVRIFSKNDDWEQSCSAMIDWFKTFEQSGIKIQVREWFRHRFGW